MKPHKHAELIKAWADGATIEVFIGNGEWYTLTGYFCWAEDNTYRIKPAPVYRQLIKGEVIQEGDEYLSDLTRWTPFFNTVGDTFHGICANQTRTTRPVPLPPAPKPVYRELVVGEIIQEGDEYRMCFTDVWYPYRYNVGQPFNGCDPWHRTKRPAPAPKPEVKPDWVISVNLNLTIDGTTNQLKSAEVIK